ncbi:MAG: hypothetical protein QM778_06795 [Myxococcales bacterium]
MNARFVLALLMGLFGSTLAGMAPASARAQEAPAPTRSVGGHLGFALPILTVASPENTLIGRDFVTVGITPGITVHLDEHWSVDFEFIAFNKWKNGTTATTFIVDPGVVYSFGSLAAGLRVATEVGAARNIGLVPIIVKPFALGNGVSYFVELDLPMFLRDNGTEMKPSLTVLFQSGFGF